MSWNSLGATDLDHADAFSQAISGVREMVWTADELIGTGVFSVRAGHVPLRRNPGIGVTVTCGSLRADFVAGLIGNKVEVVRHGETIDVPLDEDLETEIAPGHLPTDEGFAKLWYGWAKQQAKALLRRKSDEEIRAVIDHGGADWTET